MSRRGVRADDRATSHIADGRVNKEEGKAIARAALRDLGVPSTAVAISWRAVELELVTPEHRESVRRRAHQLVEEGQWYWLTDGRRGKGGDLIWTNHLAAAPAAAEGGPMAESIPLNVAGDKGDDNLRRDRWGRLLVVPPEGGKPVSYTRVTTIAKELDSQGGLMPWKATAAVVGTMLRPGIRAKWEALISKSSGDPWYDSQDSKSACKKLVEEAAEAGGSTNRRDQGTALHAITAQLDDGITPLHVTPETMADVQAYIDAMKERGITLAELDIVGSLPIEVTVVLDEWKVGGTFDRLYTVPGFDLPLIGDLKTGADLSYSWPSFAVQLAAYSRADAVYYQGGAKDGSGDTRAAMPEVDQQHGLIVWLPAGEARCELHVVDLEAGWHGFEMSMAVRQWRARRDLGVPLMSLEEALAASLRQRGVPQAIIQRALEPELEHDLLPEVRDWLQARIDTIGQNAEARVTLSALWPAGVPPLRRSDAHTAEDLLAVELAIDSTEREHEFPFGPTKPGTALGEGRYAKRLEAAFPGSTIEQETT